MDDARAAAGIGKRMIEPVQVGITVEQEHWLVEFDAQIAQLLHEGRVSTQTVPAGRDCCRIPHVGLQCNDNGFGASRPPA